MTKKSPSDYMHEYNQQKDALMSMAYKWAANKVIPSLSCEVSRTSIRWNQAFFCATAEITDENDFVVAYKSFDEDDIK